MVRSGQFASTLMSPVEEYSQNIPETGFQRRFEESSLTGELVAHLEIDHSEAWAVVKHPDVTWKEESSKLL